MVSRQHIDTTDISAYIKQNNNTYNVDSNEGKVHLQSMCSYYMGSVMWNATHLNTSRTKAVLNTTHLKISSCWAAKI